MRIWHTDNEFSEPCLICGKKENNGPSLLVPIESTREGFNAKAVPIHIKCLNLTYDDITPVRKTGRLLYQFIESKGEHK